MLAILLALALSGYQLADRVVAVVADEAILHSEVNELLAGETLSTPVVQAAEPGSEEYMQALEQLVEESLLLEAARQTGFYPSADEIDQMVVGRLDSISANFGGQEAFLEALSSSGLTVAEFRSRTADMIAGRKAVSDYLRYRTSMVMSTLPTEPGGYLESHSEMVEEVAMPRDLSWIYLPVLPGRERCAEAADTLEAARERILAGDITFEDAARSLSDDASSIQGGDLGSFGRGEMTPTFEEKVYSLQPGEISHPFRTPYGVHIVRLQSREEDDRVRAGHILIGVQRIPEDVERTLSRADSLRSLAQSGVDFEQLAETNSLDLETRSQGGSMGTILVRGWMPEVADVLEGLEAGQISEPTVLSGGSAVAVFRVNGSAGQVNYEEYPESFLGELVRSVAYETEYRTLIDSLRTTIPVIVYADSAEHPVED